MNEEIKKVIERSEEIKKKVGLNNDETHSLALFYIEAYLDGLRQAHSDARVAMSDILNPSIIRKTI